MYTLHWLLIATSVLASMPSNVSAEEEKPEDVCEVENKICEYNDTCIMLNATLVSVDAMANDSLVPTCVKNDRVSKFNPKADAYTYEKIVARYEKMLKGKSVSEYFRGTYIRSLNEYNGNLLTAYKAIAGTPEPEVDTIQKAIDAKQADLDEMTSRKKPSKYITASISESRTKIAEYREQIGKLESNRQGRRGKTDLCKVQNKICQRNDTCIAIKPAGEHRLTPVCVDKKYFSKYNPRKTVIDKTKLSKGDEKGVLRSDIGQGLRALYLLRLKNHIFLIAAARNAIEGRPVSKIVMLEHELKVNEAALAIEVKTPLGIGRMNEDQYRKTLVEIQMKLIKEKSKMTNVISL